MDMDSSAVADNGLLERDASMQVLKGCFPPSWEIRWFAWQSPVSVTSAQRSPTFFVLSLAISGLLVGILVMPWKAATKIVGFWPFGSFCTVWIMFNIMCSTASILNLCIISVDRYWAISSPFHYKRKMTPQVAFLMISVTWTLSVLIAFIPVQINWHKVQTSSYSEPNRTYGEAFPDYCDSSLNKIYAISSSLISFYIPGTIMLVLYTRIYRITQKQIQQISTLEWAAESAIHRHTGMEPNFQSERESSLKMSFTLSVIMGVFVCCWLPFFILNCMVPFCEPSLSSGRMNFPCVSSTTFDVFVWFGWANSSLNPIIYAFNIDFRKAFSILLGCRGCWSSANSAEFPSLKINGTPPPSSHSQAIACTIPLTIRPPIEELIDEEGGAGVRALMDSPALSANLDSKTDVSLKKSLTSDGQHTS